MKFLNDLFIGYNINPNIANILSIWVVVVLVILLCVVADFITKKVLLRILTIYITKNKFKWDNFLLERKVFDKLAKLVPAIIIYYVAPLFGNAEYYINKILSIYIFIVITAVASTVLDAVNDIYMTFPISKVRPIKSFLQVVKIVLYIIVGIIIIATLIDKDPIILISGIGAATAIFSLVFKDSILGFVASIQLSANDMLRIGDWAEMPKYDASGFVLDISLNTVKIQNFDKTIVTIPTYAFISESFKNWRGMQESGGRRMKRSLYIDTSSIKFCSKEMLEKFKKIHYLTDYIISKEKEIKEYNEYHKIDDSILVNGRHLTNIGTFRIYILNYLKNHPKIHKDLTLMVRQLPPGEYGLPLEIYAFINDTNWVVYEGAQADIFDHILAVVGEFELRVFQNPSGHDLREYRYLSEQKDN